MQKLEPLSPKDLQLTLDSKTGDYYTLPFKVVRDGNGIIKLKDTCTISVDAFEELLPQIITGRCNTLEELYYAYAFREIPMPIVIDDPIFVAGLIINKATSYIEHPHQSIFAEESLLEKAEERVKYIIQRSTGIFELGDIDPEQLKAGLDRRLYYASEERVSELGEKFTISYFAKRWHVSFIKAITKSIQSDQSRLSIFIGDPGTGKSFNGIKLMGDQNILVLSLSNVVASSIVARAKNNEHFKYENYSFWSYAKAHFMIGMKPDSINAFDGFILEESSMLSCSELDILKAVFDTGKPVCVLGDTAQLPGFLGLGNFLHALIQNFPDRVTELKENFRAKKNPNLVSVFSAVKRENKLLSFPNSTTIVSSSAKLSQSNAALSAWIDDVRDGCDAFACTFRQDDVVILNNIVLEKIFRLKSRLEPKNELYKSKLSVYSELMIKGSRFEAICTKNIRNGQEYKAFNGERFTITPRGEKFFCESKSFPSHSIVYTVKQLAVNFDLGYAMTIHKLQGSEADSVLYYEPKLPSIINPTNLRYVGLSRARSHLYMAIDRTNHTKFNTYNDIIAEANLF